MLSGLFSLLLLKRKRRTNCLETGYRLIDTAAVYQNEEAIGEAIKELIQAGKVTREELFITTKLWATHFHPDDVEGAIRDSLRRLQVDYVDLYLAHAPACFNHDMTAQNHAVTVEDIWRGLEGVYKKGLAKSIGVSNWSIEQIERVMKMAHLYLFINARKVHWAPAPNPMEDANVKKLAEKYSKTPAQV
ncbi:oxidoreductase, aldo/keto reductase family protein [Cooperia oncophora]